MKFFLDLGGESAIIKAAFSFFAPAFLFLLPSLRKKAGVYYRNTSKQMGIIFFSLTHLANGGGAYKKRAAPALAFARTCGYASAGSRKRGGKEAVTALAVIQWFTAGLSNNQYSISQVRCLLAESIVNSQVRPNRSASA